MQFGRRRELDSMAIFARDKFYLKTLQAAKRCCNTQKGFYEEPFMKLFDFETELYGVPLDNVSKTLSRTFFIRVCAGLFCFAVAV